MSAKRSQSESRDEPESTDPDHMLWPDVGLTRGDLLTYLTSVAAAALPHFHDRPATMSMYPQGIEGRSFFRREVPNSAPDFLKRVPYETATDRHVIQLPIVDDLRSALWFANAGAVEFHLWASRTPKLDEPDVVILDLDASETTDFGIMLRATRIVHEALEELGLEGCAKTSGGRGVHVYLPLASGHRFEDVRGWVDSFSHRLVNGEPGLFAIAKGSTHAGNRVTIDAAQNSIGRNTAAPYTPRAKPGAPVSTPLTWNEVHEGRVRPADFTIQTMPARLEKLGDLFAPTLARSQRLPELDDQR